MTRQDRDSDLDELIADITTDCYNDGEALMGFENAFDEDATLPFPGAVVGEEVEVIAVATRNGRGELIATCERRGRRYDVALLDVDVHADPATQRLIAAYRRWAAVR